MVGWKGLAHLRPQESHKHSGPSKDACLHRASLQVCRGGQRHSVGVQGHLGYLVAVGHQSGTEAVRATWPLPVVLM